MHFRFSWLNGISVACLMESVLILFAIANGMSAPLVAVMASFIYLTMPFMIAGKGLASHIGVARTWAFGWFWRYISGLLLIVAPFFGGVTHQAVSTGLILVGAFGFAMFRSIGVLAPKPLAGEIAVGPERGRFLAGSSMRTNGTHLVMMLAIVLWLRWSDSLWVYQAILAVGCCTGIYASTVLARIPESRAPRLSARRSLSEAVRDLLSTAEHRHLLVSWCVGFAAFNLVLPIMLIAVKNGYLVSDAAALFLSLLILLGAVAVAAFNGRIADRTDPRRLFMAYLLLLTAITACWAFAPARFMALPVAASFFLAGACKTGILLSLNHHFLDAIDNDRRVGTALVVQVLSGTIAGLAGALLGGGLLKLLSAVGGSGLDIYRGYFKVTLVLTIVLIAILRQLAPAAKAQTVAATGSTERERGFREAERRTAEQFDQA